MKNLSAFWAAAAGVTVGIVLFAVLGAGTIEDSGIFQSLKLGGKTNLISDDGAALTYNGTHYQISSATLTNASTNVFTGAGLIVLQTAVPSNQTNATLAALGGMAASAALTNLNEGIGTGLTNLLSSAVQAGQTNDGTANWTASGTTDSRLVRNAMVGTLTATNEAIVNNHSVSNFVSQELTRGTGFIQQFALNDNGYIDDMIYLGNGIVLAGTEAHAHIFRSTDYGRSWSDLGQQFSEVQCNAFATDGNGIVLVGTQNDGYVLRSTDYGLTFTNQGSIVPGQGYFIGSGSLAYIGNGVFLGSPGGSAGHIIRSVNYGASWTDLGANWTQKLVTAFSYLGNNTIIAGTANAGVSDAYILRSTDAGITWTNLGVQVAGEQAIYTSANLGNGITIAGTWPNHHVLRSSDYGLTWSDIGTLFSNPGQTNFWTAMTSLGNGIALIGNDFTAQVWRSKDWGMSWTNLGSLGTFTAAQSICYLDHGVTLAGTGTGCVLFRSDEYLDNRVFSRANLGTSTTTNSPEGIILSNPTDATVSQEQYPPYLQISGHSWGTIGGATRDLDWRIRADMVQAASGSSSLYFDTSSSGKNGTKVWANRLTLGSTGTATASGYRAATYTVDNTGYYSWAGRAALLSPTSSMVTLNGVTSSDVGLKTSGSVLISRLGNDSADAPFEAADITTTGAMIKGGKQTVITTSGTPQTIFYISVPNTNSLSGDIIWKLFATDGTDAQAQTGHTLFDSVAKGTTVTAGLTSITNTAVVTGGTTLSGGLTANVTTNNVLAIQATLTTSLTTTNMLIKWRIQTPSVYSVTAL